jgi:hypothetical protein
MAASAIFQSAWSSSFSGKMPQSIALIGSGVRDELPRRIGHGARDPPRLDFPARASGGIEPSWKILPATKVE